MRTEHRDLPVDCVVPDAVLSRRFRTGGGLGFLGGYRLTQPQVFANVGVAAYEPPPGMRLIPVPRRAKARPANGPWSAQAHSATVGARASVGAVATVGATAQRSVLLARRRLERALVTGGSRGLLPRRPTPRTVHSSGGATDE